MLQDKRIGVIGAGNMGEALIRGIVRAKLVPSKSVTTSDVRQERLDHAKKAFGIKTSSDNRGVVRQSDLLVLAVKPQVIKPVLEEVAPEVTKDKLVICIAAGIRLSLLTGILGEQTRIVRAMPNTPALIQEAATALCPGTGATKKDLATAQELFSAIGKTVVVEESLMDAVTGLSGSGPAYVLLVIEALIDAGVKQGLSRDVAKTLVIQTCLGTAKLVFETGEHPSTLRDAVTSPGGTTISGLHALEKGGLRDTLITAVEAATMRSKELGAGKK